jgi:hypothetical protein
VQVFLLQVLRGPVPKAVAHVLGFLGVEAVGKFVLEEGFVTSCRP